MMQLLGSHAKGVTFDELLAFLAERSKVVERSGKLFAGLGQMCSHESPASDGEIHAACARTDRHRGMIHAVR